MSLPCLNKVILSYPIIVCVYVCVCVCGGGGGGKSWGGPGLFSIETEKGWVILCFVKNHTHYNSCGRSK